MAQINPYLGFNGKCREAMNFYQQCLGGELTLMKVSETPAASQCPESIQEHIMHSSLVKDGAVLVMATDMVEPNGNYQQGNSIALSMLCNSEEEINTMFSNLSEGGKVIDPLKEQFWGGIFGVVSDKYGVRWMFNYEKNQRN